MTRISTIKYFSVTLESLEAIGKLCLLPRAEEIRRAQYDAIPESEIWHDRVPRYRDATGGRRWQNRSAAS